MATSSSSIDSKLKSPTSSTSPSTNGYLSLEMSPPPRVHPPPPIQESRSMDITLTLSPITPLDIQFNTPLHPSPLFGHLVLWNLLKAHGDSRLCFIHNHTLIFGLNNVSSFKSTSTISNSRKWIHGHHSYSFTNLSKLKMLHV
ncbi:hypothetical protein Tco_1095526 [Tanacetum coccineum]